jgi:hypothetical protein
MLRRIPLAFTRCVALNSFCISELTILIRLVTIYHKQQSICVGNDFELFSSVSRTSILLPHNQTRFLSSDFDPIRLLGYFSVSSDMNDQLFRVKENST